VEELKAIDADIVGLMEIEDDGNGPDSALQDLLDGINDVAGAGVYAFVPEPGLSPDQIKVAMLFKPARVTPVGAAIHHQVPDGTDGLFPRPPLAQKFQVNASGALVTVVVNHLKAKAGCPDSTYDENAESGDGQGCWNLKRVQQARELLTFVNDLRAGSDDRVLVIGDLNANGREDPIAVLTSGGLVNEVARFISTPYSFVFDGQAGYLDHALSTSTLSASVTGVTEWHINADEPEVLDYHSPLPPSGLFTSTPFRASDHDPVLIGIDL
jgi:predicted extracellular nuclease